MQKIIPVILLLAIAISSLGQLSRGGFPMDIPTLKSASISNKVIIMPSFSLSTERDSTDTDNLKSMKFAYTFPVSLSPENSGTWYDVDGYKVWQLQINSDGAYSLNIIFSKYYIPQGARLFVFDPERKVILGAFTCANNKPYKKLAIYPLPGDKLIVQYEEPSIVEFGGELEIGEINHDYKGVFSYNNRWDRRPSESCNVDVNCEFESGTEDQRRSVCRVIAGDELGTGTLINNVMNDGTPYLLSAFHIYDNEATAQTALYDFNYESPFCTGIDGSDIQSVSGSVAVAAFDSTDLMLVELSEMPPPVYRPYFDGWDASKVPPYNSYVIHHPNGDTKKISHDTGKCDSIRYNKSFVSEGHWKVFNWETGTTEGGSSGAALLNNDKRVTGILSGGNASCEELTFDLFSRFDKMWNYRSEDSQQLQHWLDPENSGVLQIDGYDPYYSTTNECNPVSNFMAEDTAVVLPVVNGEGFISGNNSDGITEIAEKFTGYESAVINGLSIGISNLSVYNDSPDITIRIYTGDSVPDFALKQFKFPMINLTQGAMNYLEFSESVAIEGNFYISVVIPTEDSLVLFQSAMRPLIAANTMLVMQNGSWEPIDQYTGDENLGASLLIQLMICDASYPQSTDTTQQSDFFFKAYPNPADEYLVVEFKERAANYEFWMYDMAGKMMLNECFENRMYGEINVAGINPGIYLIRVSDGTTADVRRIVIN